jgi:hypothetical protein
MVLCSGLRIDDFLTLRCYTDITLSLHGEDFMFRARSLRLVGIVMLITILFVVAVSPTSAQTLFVTSGNIASGAQFDLYGMTLSPGLLYTATLVCDELTPGNRPLDPVLSVFFPGSDSSDTINADVYNDDGFGTDDDPNGVDCNAFDSSRVRFSVPATMAVTFRADGFGSSTGPYTLTISQGPLFGVFPDGRINQDAHAPVAIYCRSGGVEVWVIVSATTGEFAFSASAGEIGSAAAGNVASARGATLVKLTDGRLEVQATQTDGKGYIFRWDACPMAHYESYVIDNGVPWLTSSR